MEHAFRSKHGIGMDEYQNDPNKLIEVEQRRDREYEQEQRIVSRFRSTESHQ
ncbi:hypothetical protein [Planococcus salinus]|uniref:hypothetical protein n=1 Tax=Planococcus salinus TaxID=1848460 RepID=UPI001864FB20|nr:hypothetical protein [Planococcus salinus]